jgi:hypothetical protein
MSLHTHICGRLHADLPVANLCALSCVWLERKTARPVHIAVSLTTIGEGNMPYGRSQIIAAACSIGLLSCATSGGNEGTKASVFSLDQLENHTLFLNCRLSCAGAYGYNRGALKRLHDTGNWQRLAEEVARLGFNIDQAYYYLGRAAEGLGFNESAIYYYDYLSHIPFRCATGINVCDGINVSKIAEERTLAIHDRARRSAEAKIEAERRAAELEKARLAEAKKREEEAEKTARQREAHEKERTRLHAEAERAAKEEKVRRRAMARSATDVLPFVLKFRDRFPSEIKDREAFRRAYQGRFVAKFYLEDDLRYDDRKGELTIKLERTYGMRHMVEHCRAVGRAQGITAMGVKFPYIEQKCQRVFVVSPGREVPQAGGEEEVLKIAATPDLYRWVRERGVEVETIIEPFLADGVSVKYERYLTRAKLDDRYESDADVYTVQGRVLAVRYYAAGKSKPLAVREF